MRTQPVHGWRKIATAAWGPPCDPQIFGDLEIDAAALLSYVERVRRRTGVRLTVTHLVGRAVAHALAECPDVNGVLRHGRWMPRDQVDVFFIATVERGGELSGVKIEHADQKSATQIAEELAARVRSIADGTDPEFGRTKKMLTWAPLSLLRAGVRLSAWLAADRNLDLPRLGLRRQPFGSAMISSVGMFGIRHAYAPLAAFYRVPFIVLVGEVTQKPVAVEGRVVVRPILPLAATLDHRYVDVSHAARLAEAVREYCHNPEAFEPDLLDPGPAISLPEPRGSTEREGDREIRLEPPAQLPQ